jgi:hypothetical protein
VEDYSGQLNRFRNLMGVQKSISLTFRTIMERAMLSLRSI